MVEVVLVNGEAGSEQSNVVAVDGIFPLLLQGESFTGVCSW